jgi:hypothetical protein
MIKEFVEFLCKKPPQSEVEVKALTQKLAELEAGEAARKDAEKTMGDRYDRHLRTVSIIVAVPGLIIATAGILMAVFGRLAQTDSREAVREMRTEVREAIAQMNSNFARLAGDALKRPRLEILSSGIPLNNHVLSSNANPFALLISIRNKGDRDTDELTFRLYAGQRVHLPTWQLIEEPGEELPFRYTPIFDERSAPIPAGDTFFLRDKIEIWVPAESSNVVCQLRVFYGGAEPANARFTLQVR